MALGATRGVVVSMVLRTAGVLVAIGLAAGWAAAWVIGSTANSFLFRTEATDPRAFAAASVDPAVALRAESWYPALQPFPPAAALRERRWLEMPIALGAVLFTLMALAWPAEAQPVPPERARAAFERLKALAGEWEQASTKDWEGAQVIQVIAGGSAILSTARVDPHPASNEVMATLFHMDGDRLMLTHYCVARNQPRLVATAISDDARVIEFTFLDGTNMRSSADGHMHRAVFTLETPDRYRSRWTFARGGQESWMEDIVTTRRR